MATQQKRHRMRLSIGVEPELRTKIEKAAADHQQSVAAFVRMTLERAVQQDETAATQNGEWARLSARSFARDWESEEDSIYDELPKG